MTANGNEVVTLSQLKMFTESSNSGGGRATCHVSIYGSIGITTIYCVNGKWVSQYQSQRFSEFDVDFGSVLYLSTNFRPSFQEEGEIFRVYSDTQHFIYMVFGDSTIRDHSSGGIN